MLETPKTNTPINGTVCLIVPPMDNQQERRETAIRLAAFFEGEATFVASFYKRKRYSQLTPVIRVGNCDPEALDEMSRILKLHNVGHRVYIQKKYSEKHAQVAVLGIEGFKRVITFLEAFGDFFFGRKRANVKLFRKYCTLFMSEPKSTKGDRNPRREQLAEEFVTANKQLNKLGVSRFLNDYTSNALVN